MEVTAQHPEFHRHDLQRFFARTIQLISLFLPISLILQLTKWAETKKLTGWYARRIAVGRDGEIQGVAQI
jgi:hypothetical protein